jgi:hypothetical protein
LSLPLDIITSAVEEAPLEEPGREDCDGMFGDEVDIIIGPTEVPKSVMMVDCKSLVMELPIS